MMALGKENMYHNKTRMKLQSCKTMKILKIYKIGNEFNKIINKTR
jgi:hypothetical protein